MRRGGMQAEPAHGGVAPPWGAALPVPGGAPRRGEGRDAPQGGRVWSGPPSSRGGSKEGAHHLPGCLPTQASPRAVVQIPVDLFQFGFAKIGK